MGKNWMLIALGALVAGCGDEAPPAAEKPAAAAALAPGEYEVTSRVSDLKSTDGSKPRTKLVAGAEATRKVCVGADAALPPDLFQEEGDTCEVKNSYVRNGKLNVQLACTRDGVPGQLVPAADGSFTADRFDAKVRTMTYFQGDGDYSMTRKLDGKRIGDCPAEKTPAAG